MKRTALTLLHLVILLFFKIGYAATFAELDVTFDSGFLAPRYQLSREQMETIKQEIEKDHKIYERDGYVDVAEVRDVTKSLFHDGRIQEGIWVLDMLGLISEAEWFAQKFEFELAKSIPTITGNVGKGVSHSNWGKVDNFPVLVKPADTGWIGSREAEVWTYHLDRILGLNIVATSIISKVAGTDFSLHPALQTVSDSGLNFRDNGYQSAYPEIFVLDFLTQNSDRHFQNSLLSPLGFLVAIDNGRSTAITRYQQQGNSKWMRYPNYLFENLPRKDITQTIAAIDIDEFKLEFGRYAPADVVEFISGKLTILKKDFGKVVPIVKARPLKRELRLAQGQMNEEELKAVREKLRIEALEQRQKMLAGFKLELLSMLENLASGAEGEDREYTKIDSLKLSKNGHLVRAFIDSRHSILSPSMVNSLLDVFRELKDQRKIGQREIRRLVPYLLSFYPVDKTNVTELAYLIEVDEVFRDLIDKEKFHADFREYLESSNQGGENYRQLMEWLPEARTEGFKCRQVLLAL